MKQLMKIAQESEDEDKQRQGHSMPAAAMIEMMRSAGMLESRNSARGAKFLKQLHEQAYGPVQDGIESAFRSGEDPEPYLKPEAKRKRIEMQRQLQHYNEARLQQLVKQDDKLRKISQNIFRDQR